MRRRRRPVDGLSFPSRQVQVRRHRELEEVLPQKSRREKEHLHVLDVAGVGIEAGDYLIAKLFRVLLSIGLALVDMEDVGLAVVPERQPRVHSFSPPASLLAM